MSFSLIMLMPLGAILDEGDALALDRPGDHAVRAARLDREPIERPRQRGVIVTVDLGDSASEGAESIGQRLERDGLLGAVALQEPVAVHDDRQVCRARTGGRP